MEREEEILEFGSVEELDRSMQRGGRRRLKGLDIISAIRG